MHVLLTKLFCAQSRVYYFTTIRVVLFVCTTNSHLIFGSFNRPGTETIPPPPPPPRNNSCANRAQVATAWSTGGTCTVCGHPYE